MRFSTFKNKTASIFLILISLLQSCNVYRKQPVTFEEAVASNNKVLLIKTDGSKQKSKKLLQVDSVFYSVSKKKGELVKNPINQSEIKSVHVLNKSASTWGNVGIITGGVFLATFIYAVNTLANAMGSGE